MCLHRFPLVNRVNIEKECRTLITCALCLSPCLSLCVGGTLFSLRLSLLLYTVIQYVTIQTPHSVTVAVLTGSLDCLVIQLKQWDPKNPRRISIMLLTKCRDATPPGNIRARRVLFACLLPQKNRRSQHKARRANLKLCCTANTRAHLQPPATSESWQKKKKESKAFRETGSSEMKANCVL